MRQNLEQALSEGRGVTAKIRWLVRADPDGEGDGRTRWIHCTPLLGHSGAVGVWMIVLVDEEGGLGASSSNILGAGTSGGARRFRTAPPVSDTIGGKQFDAEAAREKRRQGQYDVAGQRRGERSEADFKASSSESARGGGGGGGGGGGARSRPTSVMSGMTNNQSVSEYSFNLK